MLSALYVILEVCNNMSKTKASNDNLTSLTHAAVLMLSTNRELNVKRRDLLRPDLNKQYVALCNPSTPMSTQLFGDDLNKEVEDLTKANKLSKKVTPKQWVEPYRVPSGGSRGWHGRGRFNQRGRTSRIYMYVPFLGAGRGQNRPPQNKHQTAKNRQ